MNNNFDIVKALEIELARREVRENSLRISELLHDEFEEFGKSGKIFTKEDILSKMPSWEYFETKLENFRYIELSSRCLLLKYKSNIGGIEANRSSVWVKEKNQWRMIHHQGTICD